MIFSDICEVLLTYYKYCGHELYGDYDDRYPAAVDLLEPKLRHSSRAFE